MAPTRSDEEAEFWEAIEKLRAANADKDPDEVYEEVTRIVEEVRQERYERAQRSAQGRG